MGGVQSRLRATIDTERVAMMEAATADLRAAVIESLALQLGAQAPDLTMPDALNQPVLLSTLWQQELIELYSQVGNALPVLNGNGRWVLPVPATYVIDRQGRIAFAHIEADYRERSEPRDLLAAVAELRTAGVDGPGG